MRWKRRVGKKVKIERKEVKRRKDIKQGKQRGGIRGREKIKREKRREE